MKIPANDHSDNGAVAIAREMFGKGLSRPVFTAFLDAAGEEIARGWRRDDQAIAAVYRTFRNYKMKALETFDRLAAGPTKRGPESP